MPVADAAFSKRGDGRSFWTEVVESEESTVTLTWYDFAEPFMLRAEAGPVAGPTVCTVASFPLAGPG